MSLINFAAAGMYGFCSPTSTSLPFFDHLKKLGEPLDQITAEGAWLGLYDL